MFNIGDKVIILPYSEYRGKYEDCVGVIEKTYCHRKGSKEIVYGVRLEDHTNTSSTTGLFWFATKSMKIENCVIKESEETYMFKNFKTVAVQFLPLRGEGVDVVPYAYFPEDFDRELKEGDIVACSTLHHGISTAKVIKIYEANEVAPKPAHKREIVGIVDLSKYQERRNTENRLSEIKAKMDVTIQKMQQEAVYDMFAEKNPALKEMLDEFRKLKESVEG